MDNTSRKKQRQNRSKGKCWGCHAENVELVSSVWTDGGQQRICDACRKAVANHRDLDWVAVLASRRQPRSRLITRDKLIALNNQLSKLISALHKIGADQSVRDNIRSLVEPYLAPIAEDIWPKRQLETAPGEIELVPKAAAVPEGITEIVIPDRQTLKAKTKRKLTPEQRSRKARNNRNYRRRKKGIPPRLEDQL